MRLLLWTARTSAERVATFSPLEARTLGGVRQALLTILLEARRTNSLNGREPTHAERQPSHK